MRKNTYVAIFDADVIFTAPMHPLGMFERHHDDGRARFVPKVTGMNQNCEEAPARDSLREKDPIVGCFMQGSVLPWIIKPDDFAVVRAEMVKAAFAKIPILYLGFNTNNLSSGWFVLNPR